MNHASIKRAAMIRASMRHSLAPFAAALLFALAGCSATPSQGENAVNTQMSEDPAPAPAESSSTMPPASGARPTQSGMSEDPATPPPDATGADAAMACDAGKAQPAIGQTATQNVVEKIVADSGARSVRVIKPGQAVTMDFREDRVNIDVDAANIITHIRCG